MVSNINSRLITLWCVDGEGKVRCPWGNTIRVRRGKHDESESSLDFESLLASIMSVLVADVWHTCWGMNPFLTFSLRNPLPCSRPPEELRVFCYNGLCSTWNPIFPLLPNGCLPVRQSQVTETAEGTTQRTYMYINENWRRSHIEWARVSNFNYLTLFPLNLQ